jgi:hypothetical protein
MKRQGLQAMMKTIVSNTDIRSRFSSDPQGVMAEYKLNTMEKKAVLSPRVKMALATGDQTIMTDGILETWL